MYTQSDTRIRTHCERTFKILITVNMCNKKEQLQQTKLCVIVQFKSWVCMKVTGFLDFNVGLIYLMTLWSSVGSWEMMSSSSNDQHFQWKSDMKRSQPRFMLRLVNTSYSDRRPNEMETYGFLWVRTLSETLKVTYVHNSKNVQQRSSNF